MRFQRWIYTIVFMLMTGIMFQTYAEASPENALANYIKRDEPVFAWSVKETQSALDLDVYDLHLTSQTWQDIVWTHQLRVYVPKECKDMKTVLLFVNGGSNKNGQPNWDTWKGDKHDLLSNIAAASKRPVATIKQVPNQPLYGEKVEDDLISHTFLKYIETKDETWPLLLPMAKTAVQAMTALQEWGKKDLQESIEQFVVSGGSKRGWTTWLTGASDKRVIGIAPMVIDTLKMKEQMDYQLECWGQYSEQIEDYTRKGIQQKMGEPIGRDLLKIVDPYSYRKKIKIPKLIFIGTNDPYWPVDAVKFYFDDLPGEHYIHYVPNTGHGLGDGEQAVRALGAFFDICADGKEHPKLSWSISKKKNEAVLKVKADRYSKAANVWITSSTDRDFRDSEWTSKPCEDEKDKTYTTKIPLPETGYASCYTEIVYPSPIGGIFSKSTRIYVLTPEGIVK